MKTNYDDTIENVLTGEDLVNGVLTGLGFMVVLTFLVAIL